MHVRVQNRRVDRLAVLGQHCNVKQRDVIRPSSSRNSQEIKNPSHLTNSIKFTPQCFQGNSNFSLTMQVNAFRKDVGGLSGKGFRLV